MARLLLTILLLTIFLGSVVDRQKMIARESLAPVRSNGFLERDLGHPLLSLHREMNRLFDVFHDNFSGSMAVGSQHGPMMPSIDVSETDQEMRISADLPGVSEDDIGVSLVDDILTIRGEKKLDEKANYHVVERSYGVFLRSLRLPFSVDTDKIRADFANGVLTVTLPKCKDKEISRKIPVQCGRPPGSPLPPEQAQPHQNERPQGSDPNK
jgi:HSP20 family protein